MQLKNGAVLQGGRYRIEKLLGQGGFGITYLAIQSGLNRKVAIKEFFMKDLCNRDEETSHVSVPSIGSRDLVERFKAKFIKEAQMISEYRHPNIVNIYDVFEENGTAYYVMEYHDGGSLSSLDLPLSVEEASGYIRQIALALSVLHENKTMHLDIKPSNVLLDKSGNAILIDFGVSKHCDEDGNLTTTTPGGLSHGYAPGEQYEQKTLSFSPATDIYALGATFYKLLIGLTPPHQNEVYENGLPPFPSFVPSGIIPLIDKAMQPRRKDRPQSMDEFIGLLDAALSVPVQAEEPDESTEIEVVEVVAVDDWEPVPTASHKKSRKWLWWLLALLVTVICAVAVMFMGNDSKPAGSSENPSSPTEADQAAMMEVVQPVSLTGTHENHEWVDLGLSVKWATCNVGASSPGDYGNYYAWGETSTKGDYSWSTYEWYDNSTSPITKYNADDKKKKLDVSDDAARANWGGGWRLPTEAEFQELMDNCTWEWTTQNGHNGYKVISKQNGQSIFLPAAGWRYGAGEFYVGSGGYYWSSTPNESNTSGAYDLFFREGSHGVGWYGRNGGLSVRPVLE